MRSSHGPRLAFLAAFGLLIVVGYLHTLDYPYQYDDLYSIRDNPALRPPLDLAEIWRFRPPRMVTHLSLALNRAVLDSPASLRTVNVLIHAAVSLLVGWIAAAVTRRLARRRAGTDPVPAWTGGIAALLFAAHPLGTQAVTYIVQRGASLAALLELVAVAAFLRAREQSATRWWIVSWSAALLAGLTKEMSVALPGLVLLTEAALRAGGAPGRASAWRLAVYLVVVPLVGLTASLPSRAVGDPLAGFVETDEVGRIPYLLTQLTVLPRYLMLFVWPSGQSLEHEVRWVHRPEGGVLVGLGVVVAMVLGAIAVRRRLPLAALGAGWCLVALLPESSVIPIRDAMVEHRMYLPMAGLVWMVAAAFGASAGRENAEARAGRPRRWGLAVALAVALALAATTHARNRVWRDDLSLWTDAAARAPGKARPHSNRGLALERLGREAEAEAEYRRAIAVEPLDVAARANLGRLYGTRGQPEVALRLLREAERLDPRDARVLNNLGTTWWALGDTAQAAAYYLRALREAPGHREIQARLAMLRAGTRLSISRPRR